MLLLDSYRIIRYIPFKFFFIFLFILQTLPVHRVFSKKMARIIGLWTVKLWIVRLARIIFWNMVNIMAICTEHIWIPFETSSNKVKKKQKSMI